MDPISRRKVLAAIAAGGLLATTTTVRGEPGPFQSKPGDGGVARSATGLPPGDKVAYHDPKDVADLPDFRFALDGNRPKVTSGGWAKEEVVHQFLISKGMAAVHMFLDPGASRELHWHAIAAEWTYVIDGRCQTVVLLPSGASEINNYEPGDLSFFPKGHGHAKGSR
jgi:oxalate decarboxylase